MKTADEIRAAIPLLKEIIRTVDTEAGIRLTAVFMALHWVLGDEGGEAFAKLLEHSQTIFRQAAERN